MSVSVTLSPCSTAITLGNQNFVLSTSTDTRRNLLVPGSSIAGAGAAAAEGAASAAAAIRLALGSMNAATAAIAAIVFNIALLIEVFSLCSGVMTIYHENRETQPLNRFASFAHCASSVPARYGM